jgi:predicted ribosome quality control (RQC) complex YloA/Tae2 family protein
VELYSSGNIILTDHEYKILALLRVVELDVSAQQPKTTSNLSTPTTQEPTMPTSSQHQLAKENEVNFRVGEIYPVHLAKPFVPMTKARLIQTMTTGLGEILKVGKDLPKGAEVPHSSQSTEAGGKGKKSQKGVRKGGEGKSAFAGAKEKDITLRRLVREKFGPYYGPTLLDHALMISGLDLNAKLDSTTNFEPMYESLMKAFEETDRMFSQALAGDLCEGWVTLTEHKGQQISENSGLSQQPSEVYQDFLTYDEFHPYILAHLPKYPAPQHYPTFNKAVDEFYSRIESHKLTLRARQAEQNAAKKLESVKFNHQKQVHSLKQQAVKSENVANTIEANLNLVDAVLVTVRGFVASGMDWVDLWDLIQEETKKGNPIASCIVGLKLEVGMITVALLDPNFVEDEDDDESDDESDDSDTEDAKARKKRQAQKRYELERRKEAAERRKAALIKTDLDIYSSAYANASRYYDKRKLATVNGKCFVYL